MVKPELLVVNAKVRTVDERDSTASAFLVRGDTVVAVGTDQTVRPVAMPDVTVVDVGGRTVIPGIIDPHNHLSLAAFEPDSVDCGPAPGTSLAEILRAVESHCRGLPESQWVRGVNFLPSAVSEQRGPTRRELDEVAPANPVFLIDVSCHQGWTNSLGLAALGIDSHRPHPPGGYIDKDRHGDPTGYLLETAAALFHAASWADYAQRDPDRAAELVARKLAEYLALGITGVGDAMVSADVAALYQRLDERGRLPLTIQQLHHGDYFFAMQDLRRHDLVEQVRERDSARLRGGTLKVFMDPGFPDGPAIDKVENGCVVHRGGLFYSREQVHDLAVRAATLGIDTAIHAIGNCSIDMVLDAYETVRRGSDAGQVLRIEHAFVADPRQGERLARLGVDLVANPGVGHVTGDFFDAAWRGSDQPHLRLNPVRSMMEAGARVSFGSDHPAGPLNPMRVVWAAVTRATASGRTFDVEEAVTPAQALRAITINPAHASKRGDEEGSIEVGKRANFVVLDQDPIDCPTDRIPDIRVEQTYVDGARVYERVG
ncbi:amidohydrolase [Nocardioides hungaricus]